MVSRYRQTVAHLPVQQLLAHPGNVRSDLGDLTELAASIREHGILQPLVVTEHEASDERFILLAGHRRLGAAQLAGLTRVPVVIRHGLDDSAEQVVVMLVENCQRRDLNPVERAEAYGFLRNHGLSVSEIALRTGLSSASVSTYLALLDLDDESREDVRVGRLNSTDAIAAVRELRQQRREAAGQSRMGRRTGSSKAWFGPTHRLAAQVRETCRHRNRARVGGMGCGPCWEQVIATEDAQQRSNAATTASANGDVDQVLVERVVAGEWHLAADTTPAEKHAIADAFVAAGGSLRRLSELTGWKEGRYGSPLEDLAS